MVTRYFYLTSTAVVMLSSVAHANSDESTAHALDEIIVTAQKSSQNLQKTAAAVTSIGGDTLVANGITDLRAAQMMVPSVRFQQQNAATEIYIRGVGSTLDFPQVEGSSGFNFNGIYIPREAIAVAFFDMDRFEVLPGPQGTLYGRGSLGGVINATFKRPSYEYETRGIVEVGNHGLIHGTAVQNLPVSDKFALRVGADYVYTNGYQKSGAGSKDNFTIRVSALYEPTDTFSAYVWGHYAQKKGNSPNFITKGVDPVTGELAVDEFLRDDPWDDSRGADILSLPSNPFLPPAIEPFARDTDYENYMVGAQFDLEIGESTLTYIPSYLEVDVDADYFLGAFPANKTDHFDQQTHELRLSGGGNKIEWIMGAYAYRVNSNGTFFFTVFPVSIVDSSRLQGVAAFGQATYSVTDTLRLIAGGRFSYDERTGNGRTGPASTPYRYSEDFNHADFKLAVEYDLGEQSMVYAAVQTGNQPGTFNAFPETEALTNKVKSQNLTAYSIGFKSRFLDDSLQVNSEAFYYDYSDLFASALNTIINATQTFNAKSVEIYGNQLDILYQPTADDRLNLSVGYLHARNKSFDLPAGAVILVPGQPSNFDGLQLQYAPDWTITAGYSHDFQFADGSYLRAQANTRYESSFYGDFNHTLGGHQKAYMKSDASLTYYESEGRWSVAIWVKNIENETVAAATAGGNNQPFLSTGAGAFLEPPRTYGIRLDGSF